MSLLARRAGRSFTISAAIAVLVCCSLGRPAAAQVGGDSIPSTRYYSALELLSGGDYRDAGATFLDAARSGIKNANSGWIDGICYHTMAGETLYQSGDLPDALAQFTIALKLYSLHRRWLASVNFPMNIGSAPAASRMMAPWGVSRRRSVLGRYTPYQMGQGQVDQNAVVRNGGVVQNPLLFSIDAVEIMRATALAIRRRGEILGPLTKHDALSADVIAALASGSGRTNHWVNALVAVQLGSAYAAAGSKEQAASMLEQGLIADGQFDHPLTAMALVELGKLSMGIGNYPQALGLFEEATYSAANFGDAIVLEEAFRGARLAFGLSGGRGVYPPMAPALAWSKAKGYRVLHVSLALMAAEDAAAAGAVPQATALAGDARTLSTTSMAASTLGTRFKFLQAVLAFQSGNVGAGDSAIAGALQSNRRSSLWLFQLGETDRRFASGQNITDRIAIGLFDELLRDPTPLDWQTSPMETLTYLTTPHHAPLEHWFTLSLDRSKEQERALEIADQARRHRFYVSLGLGGRLLSLRWLLEGPTDLLSERAQLQRKDVLARFPEYEQLSKQVQNVRDELELFPRVPEDAEQGRKQASALAKLATLGSMQEAVLRRAAIERLPAEMTFPPLRTVKEIQTALPAGEALLTFYYTGATTHDLYAFMLTKERYHSWAVISPEKVQKGIATALRDLGNIDGNIPINGNDLTAGKWHKSTQALANDLFEKSDVDLGGKFDELVIVPDGALWYLPFEALPVGKEGDQQPLINRVKIRYAPTMGLAIPYTQNAYKQRRLGVVVGKLYPQDADGASQKTFDILHGNLKGTFAWPTKLLASTSSYRQLFDALLVLDDIEPTPGTYDWSPGQLDRNKPGGSLDSWMSLPWGGPQLVALPGFHSSAESSMKKNNTAGSDIFLAVTGLMSTGVRTVLISRWRTGGQISQDLVREFAQELPNTSAADAWQRSVQIARESPLDMAAEPRLKKPSKEVEAKADHPFFWAGYVLADTGTLREGTIPPPALDASVGVLPAKLPAVGVPLKPAPLKPLGAALGQPLPGMNRSGLAVWRKTVLRKMALTKTATQRCLATRCRALRCLAMPQARIH